MCVAVALLTRPGVRPWWNSPKVGNARRSARRGPRAPHARAAGAKPGSQAARAGVARTVRGAQPVAEP